MSKPFTWSFSKLKNYETCPLRYYEIDVAKNFEQPRSEALDRGDELHDAMRVRVQGNKPLPPHLIYMEPWAVKLTSVVSPLQIIQCELKLSLSRDGKPTGYFDNKTWFRTKIDYLRIVPTGKKDTDFAHIVDYKTGRPPKVPDNTQLTLNTWTVFQHYSYVQQARIDYLWSEYNDTSHEVYTRKEMPGLLLELTPRVTALELAHKEHHFPAKPNGLCAEYCDVTTCQFHGKRLRR